jgi:colanic acid biosynthesis glycosyl transferase WcaI
LTETGEIILSSNKQRVWVASELYYPELTSTGYFLTGIAEGLASEFEVHVLCGQPSYLVRGTRAPKQETRNGVDVYRCAATTFDKDRLILRAFNTFTVSLSFFFAALFRLQRGDILIAVTNPPLLPYLMAIACWLRRSKFVLLIHDVYPEVFVRLGMLPQQNFAIRMMDVASCWLYRTADTVVALGRDMQELAQAKIHSGGRRVVIATNWGDTEAIYPMPIENSALLKKIDLQGKFVAQYCGNIGRTHGMEDLVGAAMLLKGDDIFQILVIGWGARRQWLDAQISLRHLDNLMVCDPLPLEDLCDGLNSCNVAVISMAAGMSGISVPSRMYNVLAAGKPLIVICDSNSEIAAVVMEEKIGWVIPPGRPDMFVAALREAKNNPDLLDKMGKRARAAAEAKYTASTVVAIYKNIVAALRPR